MRQLLLFFVLMDIFVVIYFRGLHNLTMHAQYTLSLYGHLCDNLYHKVNFLVNIPNTKIDWFLSHLLIAGCDIGVQLSVLCPSVHPSAICV